MTVYNTLLYKILWNFYQILFFAVLVNFSFVTSARAQMDPLQQIMESRMAQLQDTGSLTIDGNKIAAHTLIPELYTKRHFTLAWQDGSKRDELLGIISHIDSDGLNPEDYLFHSLLQYHAQENQLADTDRVDFDILLTESLVRLGYHLRFGKVDPKSQYPDWNLNRSLENEDPAAIIQAARSE